MFNVILKLFKNNLSNAVYKYKCISHECFIVITYNVNIITITTVPK